MQNKGLIRIFAIIFGALCLYYLSFTFISNKVEGEANDFAKIEANENTDIEDEIELKYLDSVGNDPVALGISYNDAKEYALRKGLDLKGGINVIVQISIKDILRGLANNSEKTEFLAALSATDEIQKNSQNTYFEDFFSAFEAQGDGVQLSDPDLFSNIVLGDKIKVGMSNNEVRNVLNTEIDESIISAFETLRNRVDRFGTTQPNIQRLGESGRILIELPGAKDTQRVIDLVTKTAQLEFYETHFASDAFQYLLAVNDAIKTKLDAESTDEETEVEVAQDSTAQENAVDDLLEGADDEEAEEVEKNPIFDILSINPDVQRFPTATVIGYATKNDTAVINNYLKTPEYLRLRPQNIRFAKFRWGIPLSQNVDEDAPALYPLYALVSNRSGEPNMNGDVVNDSYQDFEVNGQPDVIIQFEGQGIGQWAKLTGDVGAKRNTIAIVLDNIVYSSATAPGAIEGGNTQITGNFTVAEAQDLSNVLKAGKLPASAELISAEVIGPSLGQEAIDSGVKSFILALILVLIWMVFYYGRAGLYADVALVVNILFIFGVLVASGVVLTLPGLAGIVLTIGMSVDANVLIFERIKEELRKGKSQKDAIKDGFNNALSSILDANITTFLTALILFVFGTGPVQGFGVTLMIGIATSLFTAIFITRLFIDGYGKNGKSLTFSTPITKDWFANMKVDWLGKRKIAYMISGVLILVSVVSLFTNKLDAGVDFVGGRSYTVRFENAINANEVEQVLSSDAVFGSADAKTYGADNQLKITTKYRIDESGREIDTEIEQKLFEALKPYLPSDHTFDQFSLGSDEKTVGKLRYYKVGPTIADDIKQGAFLAVLGSLIVVFLYILLRFRRWQFSLGAVTAVFHDVLLVLGIFSLTHTFMPFDMEIDQNFIAAILTVIGYSLNDTVVVFDRIREYFREHESTRGMFTIINQALNSTLSRTLNTSVTTFIVLLAIFILGAPSIRGLMFALMVGVIVGTYSSLFIATPVMFDTVQKKALKPEAAKADGKEEVKKA